MVPEVRLLPAAHVYTPEGIRFLADGDTVRVVEAAPALDLIGPAPAFFHRVRGEYRYQIIVRGPDPRELLEDIALPLGWRVDVDPVSVL